MARLKSRPSALSRAADAHHNALINVLRAEFGEEPHAPVDPEVAAWLASARDQRSPGPT